MTTSTMTGGKLLATLIRVRDVQDQLDRLKAERDQLIRLLDGEVGVRALGRHLGMSAAQVSRIRSRA